MAEIISYFQNICPLFRTQGHHLKKKKTQSQYVLLFKKMVWHSLKDSHCICIKF